MDEPPRADARSRSSRTQDGLRTVAPSEAPAPRAATEDVSRARASRTQDGLRASVPTPPPAERDLQTAMIRMPVLPPEGDEDTAPVTSTPRRSVPTRRRQGGASTEPTTQPVRFHDMPVEDDEEESTVQGRGDTTSLRHARAPKAPFQPQPQPPPRRNRAWMAVTAVVSVLALSAAVVMLELDGGVVSSRLKPLLGQGAPPPPQPTTGTRPPVNAGKDLATGAAAPVAPPVNDGPKDTGDSALTIAETVDPATLTDQLPVSDEIAPDADPATEDDAPLKGPRTFKRVRNGAQRSKAVATAPRKAPATPPAPESVPAGEPGFLTLVTEPKAQVFLGGQDLGKTPLFKVKLPAGQHTLKLVDATAKAHQVPVDIKPGETTSVRGPLSLLSDP